MFDSVPPEKVKERTVLGRRSLAIALDASGVYLENVNGAPIATVGNSGGQDRAALYFEIRHQGKPTDPARWCSG